MIAHRPATLDDMDLFSLDSQTAKNIGLGTIGVSVLGLLFALKFVKSVVSKILFIAFFGLLGYLSFTQRDALSICAAKIEANVSQIQTASCTFFGQEISLKSINP